MHDDLITIARFESGMEAHEARIELDSRDIECVIAGETATDSVLPGGLGAGSVELLVRASDVARAVEVLRHTPAGRDLDPDLGTGMDEDVSPWFLATPEQLEAKVREWGDLAGDRLFIDHLTSYSGDHVYALTLSDFDVPREQKHAHYFAQPHAHEPGTTAGMMDVIEQLVTGKNLRGEPTSLDVDQVLAQTLLTFNPIGNPQGRAAAPVLCWDGADYTNDELWCWMRGEDPAMAGKMWQRLDLWDTREVTTPDPIGIVYEQIDEFRYVEPNRSHLSSYFKLFFQMDGMYAYECWLDLHQTEFVNSDRNCMMLLPIEGLATGDILATDRAWGQAICNAWSAAGYRPAPQPEHLGYTGTQANYFCRTWGPLHQRMNIVSTEVKNNAADAPAAFQLDAQGVAITRSIERLLG